MAGINLDSLNKGLGIAGGALGLVGAGIGAAKNVPQASSIDPYMNDLYLSAMDYQPSTMEGMMMQANATPYTPQITGKTLYNPTLGEQFASMFGAGMGMYNAASDLTQGLKGKINSHPFSKAKDVPTSEEFPDITPYEFDASGTMKSDGGHLFFDGGAALGMGLNLGAGLIGTLVNYAGIQNQKRQAEADAATYNATKAFVDARNQHNFNLAVEDTKNNMFNNQALQMMAEGGVMIKPSKKGTFTAAATKHGMGVQEFARKVLANPDDYSPLMRRKANFARNSAKWHAEGGDLSTNGTEFPLLGNFNYIGNGGSHENNPQQGVPQGLASDGQENLVEEGEVVWNDYVFSRRLTVPEKFRKQYKLKEGTTFAEAAQKLTGEAKERPNDPISQNGMEEVLGALQAEQEDVRAKKQAREMQRALKNMTPEELMQLGAILQQSQAQPQEQMVPEQGIDPNALQGMVAACGGKLHANGGHLYEDAGELDRVRTILSQYGSDDAGYNRLVEIAKLAMGDKYQGSAYTSTDFTNLINDIVNSLTGNKYESLRDLQRRTIQRERLTDRDALWQSKESTDETKWVDLFNRMGAYRESKKKGNTPYKYHDDPNFSLEGLDVAGIESSDDYKAFKNYVLEHSDDENVQRYLKMLDEGINTEQGTETLFNEQGKLKENWKDLFRGRSFDQIGGIYHFFTRPENKSWRERDIYRVNGQEVQMTPEQVSAFMRLTGEPIEYGDNGDITRYHDYTTMDYDASTTELPEDTPIPRLPVGLRYAPVLGSVIGALQALTERPKDYSTNVRPYLPAYQPIGDYLTYNPVDTQRYLMANQRQMAAQRNAIANMSGANKNMAMAQMALANQQEQENMANILNTAEAMNFARKAQVGEFNRGTNQFNAQAFNAIQPLMAQRDQLLLNQAQRNAATRMAVDQAIDEAKGQNLTNLFDNLGAIGQENLAYNMANSNRALDYIADITGISRKRACGGMLTKKNRRK